MLFVGDDWAEDHHDVELVDDAGRRLARACFRKGWTGCPAPSSLGALRRASRRNIDAKAQQLQALLRAPALRQPASVQTAYAAIVVGQVRLIAALNAEIESLGEVVAEHFGRHRGRRRSRRPVRVRLGCTPAGV